MDTVGLDTEVGCSDAGKEVEAGYLATLPSTTSWAMDIDTGPGPTTVDGLVLQDAAGETILAFEESSLSQTYADVRELIVRGLCTGCGLAPAELRECVVPLSTRRTSCP